MKNRLREGDSRVFEYLQKYGPATVAEIADAMHHRGRKKRCYMNHDWALCCLRMGATVQRLQSICLVSNDLTKVCRINRGRALAYSARADMDIVFGKATKRNPPP